MAVVEFGAAALGTTRANTSASPKTSTSLSSFSTGGVVQQSVQVVNVVTASVQYFKRGYYVAGSTFEYWRTTLRDAPSPSGNPLIDITILNETREF